MSETTAAVPGGPYETERAARSEPYPRAVYARHRVGRDAPTDSVAQATAHLLATCEAAGVQLGAYDVRILTWLAGWEPETVQVVAGLIGRAHTAGRRGAVTDDAGVTA
jgi:hypothetical protein